MKKFYQHCFECPEVREGDVVPAGDVRAGGQGMPWSVKADLERTYANFEKNFDRHEPRSHTPEWKNWIGKILPPGVDVELAAALQTFICALGSKSKLQTASPDERAEMFEKAPERTVALSAILDANHASSLEISLLAKYFLEKRGFSARLFSGETIYEYSRGSHNEYSQRGHNISTARTFLIIEHHDREYIFDPMCNTIRPGNDVELFSLFEPCRRFAAEDMEELMREMPMMVGAKNVLSNLTAYYGVGDGSNVVSEHVIHPDRWASLSRDGHSNGHPGGHRGAR